MIFTLMAFALPLTAQKLTLPASFAKGTIVVPKFSADLLIFQKVSAWSGRSSYVGTLSREDTGIYIISNDSDWKNKGWALMQEFAVEKIDKEKGGMLIELRSQNANLKLRLDPSIKNLEEALKEAFFLGSLYDFKKSEYYKNEVVQRHLPRIFNGKLEELPEDFKLKLIEGVRFNAAAIKGEDFKGKFYLSLDVGAEDVFYNTIQVNQAERTSKTVERILNAGLKQAAELEKYPVIEGVKFIVKVGYADFLREGQYPAHYDEIQMYFPLDELIRYRDADITNQQLVDKSIILVNGNRVQVSLIQFN